jgi:hypothetical protein
VLLGDSAGDGETEAVSGFAGVESDEALEDAPAFVLGDAGAVVCNLRLDVSVQPSDLHVDSARGLDGGEGVVDEVAENAFERVSVAMHGGVVIGAEGDRGVGSACPGVLEERACDGGELDRRAVGVRLEPGEAEEVVNEAAEPFAVAGDGCFQAVALGPFGLLAQQSLDACLKGGDRSAKLVRGVRKEAAGCGVAGACLLDRRFEGVDHTVERDGEPAEFGVVAARVEAEAGLAVGDASRRLDDGGEGTKGGARAVNDEEGGERERSGRDEELDEQQVDDSVADVPVRAALRARTA